MTMAANDTECSLSNWSGRFFQSFQTGYCSCLARRFPVFSFHLRLNRLCTIDSVAMPRFRWYKNYGPAKNVFAPLFSHSHSKFQNVSFFIVRPAASVPRYILRIWRRLHVTCVFLSFTSFSTALFLLHICATRGRLTNRPLDCIHKRKRARKAHFHITYSKHFAQAVRGNLSKMGSKNILPILSAS